MALTQPTSQSTRPRALQSVMTALGGIAAFIVPVLLLCFVVFGAWALAASAEQAESAAEAAETQKTTAEAHSQATVTAACALAARQLTRGETDAANELLSAAGMTADNYASLPGADAQCISTWLLTAPEPAASPSGWEAFGKAWDGFVKATFTPVTAALTFVVACWLALFVLARLLVEVPGVRKLTSDRRSRAAAARLGWPLLAAVPVAAVVAGAAFSGVPRFVVWALLTVLAGVAVVAVGTWLATLRVLRIDVTTDGAEGEGKFVSTALVTAQLRDLSSASGAIDLPTGPLVKDLADSLKDFSSVAWVAAVQKIVLFLIGVTPWVATAVVRSGTGATVSVVRNRATVSTKRVWTSGPGLEPLATPPDGRAGAADFLSVMIAAEILFALREGYRAEFDPGLAGATNARSVGLQYIAITWYTATLDTSAATTLLAAATRADPDNQLARYSFAYVQDRRATTPERLIAFGDKLDKWIRERQRAGFGFSDQLLQAMTVARAAAARNLAALAMARRLQGGAVLSNALREDALKALGTARKGLDHLLASGEVDDTDEAAARRLRFGAATLTRAAMVLNRSDAPAPYIADLTGALAGALDEAEERASAATDALDNARTEREAREIELAAEDGPPVPARTVALAAARRAEKTAEKAGRRAHRQAEAVRAIIAAREDDPFRTDATLAYSLATELVCWERQRLIDCPPVSPFMKVSAHVPVLDEFAMEDPELATAEDFGVWKRDRERAARAARAAAAAKAAAASAKGA